MTLFDPGEPPPRAEVIPLPRPTRPPRANGLFDTVTAFRARSQHRDGLDELGPHLSDTYGIKPTAITELDAGVLKIDRDVGPPWVARVFPPDRPRSVAEGEAALLSYLVEAGLPVERPVADPVSDYRDQAVLVTEFVEGDNARGVEDPAVFETLGDYLGRLHSLPVPDGLNRPVGAWHSLSVDGGGKAADVEAAERLIDDLVALAPPARVDALEGLRAQLHALDTGDGLPVALTHPDYATPNVIRTPDGELILVDWTGAGVGPRVCSVGLLVWNAGGNPALIEAAATGYRRHVSLTDEERGRLTDWCRGQGPALAVWSVAFRGVDPAPFAQRMPAGRAHAGRMAALFVSHLDT